MSATMGREQRGSSVLDTAYGLRLAGEREPALRWAAALVTAAPESLGAALLLARLLVEHGRPAPARTLAEASCARAIERGELPYALAATLLGGEIGSDTTTLRTAIANAFGLGSTRRSATAAPLPPPLLPGELAPHFAALSGAALLEAAEKAAARVAAAPAPARAAPSEVPELPLFGALAPAGLARLLGCFTLRELPTGAAVVTQGEPGAEAFVVVRGRCEARRHGADPTQHTTALATLGAGAVFGEMALVSAAPRAASIVAVEPLLLLVAERSALEAVAQDEPAIGAALSAFCEERMLANLLRHSPMLSSLPPSQRAELLTRLERRSLARGDALVRQGHDSDGVYLIASGQVQVRASEQSGEELVLAQLGAGDVVGEISLVLRRPATADVLALSPTVALLLRRDAFQEVVREHPTLLRDLYELAVERDEETRSVVAQQALDASDLVIV